MSEKKSSFKITDFLLEYQVIVAVGFGVLGLLVSTLMLTNRNGQEIKGKKNTPYGEVVLTNKSSIVIRMLNERIRILTDTIYKMQVEKDPIKKAANAMLERELYVKRQNAFLEKNRMEHGREGTLFSNYGRYLLPDKDSLIKVLRSDNWVNDTSQTMQVPGFVVDTVLGVMAPVKLPVTFNFKQNKQQNLMDFIDRYPKFGLWVILTIAQIMIWFQLIPLLIGNVISVEQRYGEEYKVSLKNILMSSIFPLLFILIFCVLLYFLLIDSTVIPDAYFFTDFNFRMYVYAIFGYLVVSLCFGTYISLVRKVVVNADEKNLSLATDKENIKTRYEYFKTAFDNAFLASSIILSLFVIWTGVMINAVNNLEGPKLYSLIFGKQILSEDFPYLLGLMHSCILFIFYIPVRLRFDSMNLQTSAGGGQKPRTIFEFLSKSLGTLLVTASPLLASLLQGIFTTISS
jgi:hypothetical protein